MCGRYYSGSDKQAIAERFQLRPVPEMAIAPDYNIAPTTFQPVIRMGRDSGERELELMRWGLVPYFAKSLRDFKGYATFNARAETLATSATFRGPFRKRRCLVPADGFYEWKTVEAKPEPGLKREKQPYAISLTDGEPMAFAGVWDAWKEPGGEGWLQSFSIVTTEANEAMAAIHTRMPVIVPRQDWAEWLDRDEGREGPVHLLRPIGSDGMRVARCNPLVGNVRNNGVAMLNSE
jgi:putative SOS response-associated peptidase YedK